jgi:hypothetical protein
MVESTTTPVSPISGPGPRDVVASFLNLTVDKPNLEKAKLHLTRRSVETGNFHSVPAGTTYTLGAEEADELGRRIVVNMKSPGADGAPQEMAVPVIVVQEEGAWKVDLPATMDRMFGGAMDAMGKAVGAMGEALSTAMAGVGEALSEGMGAVQKSAPVKKAVAREKQIAKAVKKTATQAIKTIKAKLAARKARPAKPVKTAKSSRKAARKIIRKPVKKITKVTRKAVKRRGK